MTTVKSKTKKPETAQVIPAKTTAENLPAVNPLSLLDKAIEKDLDISKLKELMELQERWQANKAHMAFTEAFTNFQAIVPPIVKEKKVDYPSSKGGNVKYSYASLAGIIKQIQGPLTQFGISYRWEIKEEGPKTSVTCIIEHIEGHSKTTTMSASDDTTGNKNAIQAHGSVVSYLQRYTLISALGLGTAQDDVDGQLPKKEAAKQAAKQEPVAQPVPELSDEMQLVIAECGSGPELDEVWKHNKQLHADQSFNLAIGIRRVELTGTIEDLQIQWNLNASLHGLKKYRDAVNSRKAELGVKS